MMCDWCEGSANVAMSESGDSREDFACVDHFRIYAPTYNELNVRFLS